jgi:hypothetical protein
LDGRDGAGGGHGAAAADDGISAWSVHGSVRRAGGRRLGPSDADDDAGRRSGGSGRSCGRCARHGEHDGVPATGVGHAPRCRGGRSAGSSAAGRSGGRSSAGRNRLVRRDGIDPHPHALIAGHGSAALDRGQQARPRRRGGVGFWGVGDEWMFTDFKVTRGGRGRVLCGRAGRTRGTFPGTSDGAARRGDRCCTR